MSFICGWTWVPEDTSAQPTSEYIKCKDWMCRKTKTTVFSMRPASWSTGISSFYYSDSNLFLIDYSWCKLCNIWLLLPFENNIVLLQGVSLYRSVTLEEKHCCSYYSRSLFSVYYAGLYINLANTSLFIIPGTLLTLLLPVTSHPSSR